MEDFQVINEPMDALSVSSQVMDENIVTVVLKEEPADRFTHSYIEDICSGTLAKIFLPIDNHEVDFTDEMVKLDLENQSSGHHSWAVQLATATLCDRVDGSVHRCLPLGVNFGELAEKSEDSTDDTEDPKLNDILDEDGEDCCDEEGNEDEDKSEHPKFYKIQCTICKKWFLNNDSMITHLRSHCGGGGGNGNVANGDQCQVCQQSFQDNSSLHAHMLTHVGMNPVECNICQKRFAYKWCLRNHVQTHVAAAAAIVTSTNCCPPGIGSIGSNIVNTVNSAIGIVGADYNFDNSSDSTRKMYNDRVNIVEDRQRKDIMQSSNKTENETRGGEGDVGGGSAGGGLRCDICKMRFKDRDTLNRHTLVHMSEGPYKYDIFSGTFRDKPESNVNMQRVQTTNTSSKQFKCTLCERSFGQRPALNNHMLAHSGEKPHACNICEKTYKRKSELIRHTMVHTGERPYECKECLMTFREKAKLNSHMLVHTGEKPHECYICHKACARKSDLNSHMLSHTGGQYDCKICDKIFTRKSDLNRHTLIHTGEKPFACELCDMAFRERTRLNSHMLVHTGDKRHACHICGKSFREKSSLKKHMIIHTGDRPYECFVCKKTFTQKTTLNSHVLVHTGERPYECDNCPKSFKERSSLRKHSLFHNSERGNHECNVCFKKFNLKTDLCAHAAMEHTS